jgi:hypothetical protein
MFSCSPERKLAKQFVGTVTKPSLLVLMPLSIFKENLKVPEGEVPDSTTQAVIIDKLSDSVVISRFNASYMKELKNYGLQVFQDASVTDFMDVDSNAWVVNIAQMELQEYSTIYVDTQEVLGMEYSYDIPLNGVNSAYWFEFSRVNAPENIKPEVMFAANDLYDQFNGKLNFDIFTGAISYNLQSDTITEADFYRQLDFSARLYAGYTFDYLMNNYIGTNITDDLQMRRYFRYDPYLKSIFVTEYDKFIPLNQ